MTRTAVFFHTAAPSDWNGDDYLSDVQFPKRITQKRGGNTVLDLTIQKTNTYNPYVVMPVPAGVLGASGRPVDACTSVAMRRMKPTAWSRGDCRDFGGQTAAVRLEACRLRSRPGVKPTPFQIPSR